MMKIVNGIQKVLALTDFEVNKLSDRLGLMEFNGYTISRKTANVEGQSIEYNVFSVKCINSFNGKQITVNVTYEGTNKGILDTLAHKVENNPLEKAFIDFDQVLIGHYISGGGNFSQLMQTYRAEKVRTVDNNEAQGILNMMKNNEHQVNNQERKPEQK